MYAFDIYMILLKIVVSVQFMLILLKKQSITSIEFLISEMVFKISLGIFLMVFFWLNKISEIRGSDKVIIGFAGVVLIYDAVHINLPHVLEFYGIHFKPLDFVHKLIGL
jgi:hypothetical protein